MRGYSVLERNALWTSFSLTPANIICFTSYFASLLLFVHPSRTSLLLSTVTYDCHLKSSTDALLEYSLTPSRLFASLLAHSFTA